MGLALNVTVELVTEVCCTCGLSFAIPQALHDKCRRDHSHSFYCPAGHGQHYSGETDAQKYKRLFEAEQQKLKWGKEAKERQERLLLKTGKQLKNLKKRVSAGVCPCCKRTVSQMARHMAAKHPDYQTQEIGS